MIQSCNQEALRMKKVDLKRVSIVASGTDSELHPLTVNRGRFLFFLLLLSVEHFPIRVCPPAELHLPLHTPFF